MFKGAERKVERYNNRLAELTDDYVATSTRWRQFKITVRQAHWRKNLTQEEEYYLSLKPWKFIEKLRRMEAFMDIFQRKIEYYRLIARTNAQPSEELNRMRVRMNELAQAIGILQA